MAVISAERILISIFLLVMLGGTVLKLYTRRKLSYIDGLSPIIKQDMEQEHIIGAFGEES
ncbi:hypothetical protein [Hespellia stercorisuis]|uniref:Uncharacterized protein n=1 Tax=Hespellia stercorisuis DSM 15480 TaxID=1121950 RepID=A0A1M6W0B1_9FIRM|nr:hypothetical protein [Hespellia stercorisuis]SHK87103.1 hypothetical protein SAMN02745243_03901 [Hespellia stercorisuis DSM 15480]